MSGAQGRPQGERLASLEKGAEIDAQDRCDLWTAIKDETSFRHKADDLLSGRVAKLEIFMGRVALLMALGAPIALAIFGAALAYFNNLVKH